MNRIDRLTAILIQLQSRRVIKGGDIAERFGISLRTVYRDIRALEEAGVPIYAEPGRGYTLVEGYHLPPVMFTQDEAGALLMGGKLVEKFSDHSIRKAFSDALYKIKAVLAAKEKDHLEILDEQIEIHMAVNREKERRNSHFLSDIQSALGYHGVLEIAYLSFSKDELTARLIDPLGLCFYAGNWHLFAYCRLRKDYRDFRVDRIKSLTTTDLTFQSASHPSLQTLFQKITAAENLEPTTVRFSPKAARSIREQRYYFGFTSELPCEDYVEMQFMVTSLSYFAKWLLLFQDEATVVSPPRLTSLIQSYVRRLYLHYSE